MLQSGTWCVRVGDVMDKGMRVGGDEGTLQKTWDQSTCTVEEARHRHCWVGVRVCVCATGATDSTLYEGSVRRDTIEAPTTRQDPSPVALFQRSRK